MMMGLLQPMCQKRRWVAVMVMVACQSVVWSFAPSTTVSFPLARKQTPGQELRAVEQDEDAVTFIKCSSCDAVYTMGVDDLPPGGGRVKCAVCNNVWFQSSDRLNTLFSSFDLEPYPPEERAQYSGRAPAPPRPRRRNNDGVSLFVANLAFDAEETDLLDLFSPVMDDGDCDATVVRSDDGRSKGFGFVNCASTADAEKAIDMLNGAQLYGRDIVVRMGNKNARN